MRLVMVDVRNQWDLYFSIKSLSKINQNWECCSVGQYLKLELSYNIKGKDYGAAFKQIEQASYRACVSGAKIGTTYKLLSYSRILSNWPHMMLNI